MAKKAKAAAPPKKRESTAAAPKAEEGKVLGTVSIPVQVSVFTGGNTGTFSEIVVEWSCLGLSVEPDTIIETSGNSVMLDPKHPPTTSDEGMHIYFDPPLAAGNYGFQFLFTYNEAVEARVAIHEEPAEEEAA